jgi:predicted DCC family thiol-disulfide oxidoreductase YuxK
MSFCELHPQKIVIDGKKCNLCERNIKMLENSINKGYIDLIDWNDDGMNPII